ncbi:MAG TPA: hypothetical protein VGR90_02990 [Acidimicrobiales bacterium]|nr:hypothetical protein [Acidimicrobiales bacterium]
MTTRHAWRASFVTLAACIGLAVVLIPFAAASMVSAVRHPVDERSFPVISASHPRVELNLAVVGLEEASHTLTLRASGYHDCPCAGADRLRLFSVGADQANSDGPPPSADIDLGSTPSQIDTTVTLADDGSLSGYPFDRYHTDLGVALYQVDAAGTEVPVASSVARSALAVSVGDEVPRTAMTPPRLLSVHRATDADYAVVAAMDLSRPLYLQLLTVLLVLLVTVAALYGVLFRPFDQIVLTVGGIVLGVWGVRSLLVGSYPADSTAVDLVLSAVILMLLLVIAVRGLVQLYGRMTNGRAPAPPSRSSGHADAQTAGELPEVPELPDELVEPSAEDHVPVSVI